MPRLLLVVQDAFAIKARGVIVAPFLDPSEARRERFHVELRRRDGSRRIVEALAQVPFIHPTPKTHHADVMLFDVTKDDVPIGTEIWALDASPPR